MARIFVSKDAKTGLVTERFYTKEEEEIADSFVQRKTLLVQEQTLLFQQVEECLNKIGLTLDELKRALNG